MQEQGHDPMPTASLQVGGWNGDLWAGRSLCPGAAWVLKLCGEEGALRPTHHPGESVSCLCPYTTKSGHYTAYRELGLVAFFCQNGSCSLLNWEQDRPKPRLLNSALPPQL